MRFIVKIEDENIINISRKIGYRPVGVNNQEEYSIVRPIAGSDYPRFHIYIKEEKTGDFIFNLHLDQKKPSYSGVHAHSGEYEGELVNEEAKRIKRMIGQNN